MSNTLTNQTVQSTYNQLLHMNAGIGESVKRIFDGDGTGSPLWMSTNMLQVDGILNLKEYSSAPDNPTVGDLAFINDELYIAKQ
tara:strand:+ start:341 stop:592 length:252 start_codon:yes stop_codon:yes gene_type:complete